MKTVHIFTLKSSTEKTILLHLEISSLAPHQSKKDF